MSTADSADWDEDLRLLVEEMRSDDAASPLLPPATPPRRSWRPPVPAAVVIGIVLLAALLAIASTPLPVIAAWVAWPVGALAWRHRADATGWLAARFGGWP